jgi:FtsH-binding integral membrane protein
VSDADARLQALFAADQPPASDPAFRLAVLERRSLRQFRDRIVLLCACGLAVIACLLALARAAPAEALTILAREIWPGTCIAVAILCTVWGVAQLRRPI